MHQSTCMQTESLARQQPSTLWGRAPLCTGTMENHIVSNVARDVPLLNLGWRIRSQPEITLRTQGVMGSSAGSTSRLGSLLMPLKVEGGR